ncbi:hypothetical protein O1R50_13205 [Glycomyces luteolus]|uniref:Uncharacterized protein n=1 Tax=Glycomyces luteolus TaxID=2670330 RepID=A0A9X3P8C6_9ACTN|nr:hypothetical protein [Glycomyces luteolus]MDA1360588.1 hypothetical protein [Glycomyces luteolus]
MDANGPNRDDDTSRKPEKDDKKPRPSGRPADAEDENGAAGLGLSFGVGAPQPADPAGAGPDVNVPSGEAASIGLDPDHGVSSNIPIADAQFQIPVGDQVVPVKAVLGLTLKGWAAIGGILIAGAVGISVANAEDDTGPGPSPDPTSETTGFGGDTTDVWGGEETAEYVESDPVAEAAIGDCFDVSGDIADVEVGIESTYCGAGAFEVIDIVEGTNDLSACDAEEDNDQSVTSTVTARVLCLAYIPIDGDTAYRAQLGECVYGPNDYSSAWTISDCDTGAFEVIERYEGESDADACANDSYGDRARTYAATDSYFDVTLCLRIIYPDDLGYAEQYTCMVLYEDDSFEYADSCETANVRVVGRTSDYEASGFCEGYGWSTWQNPDFPEHGYTVCWEWY